MLTQQWFYENIPEKVETYDDYRKVVHFLRDWRENTKDVEALCHFIYITDDIELTKMSTKVWKLANLFLDFCSTKYKLLREFLKDNANNLLSEQATAIFHYSETDLEESKSIAEALKTVALILEIKKERK